MNHTQATQATPKMHVKADEMPPTTQFKPHQMQLQHNAAPEGTDHVYLRNRANPFHPTGGSDLWNRSELILKDQKLREKSGVSQIDQSLTRSYLVNPDKMKY